MVIGPVGREAQPMRPRTPRSTTDPIRDRGFIAISFRSKRVLI
jgi:hypothetical protein